MVGKKIYIAGPMRGYWLYNFLTFDRVAARLQDQGYEVFNPAAIDRANGFNPEDLPDDWDWSVFPEGPGLLDRREVVRRDVAAILQCDAIYMLAGWEKSDGATAEHAIAKWIGLDIIFETNPTERTFPIWPDGGRIKLGQEILREIKDTNPKDAIGSRKAPMSTVSVPVIMELGVAMLEGACKYARHNYRVAGVRSSVYYDAAWRHLGAWWEGEDIDANSSTKLSHLVKAMACLAVLRDAEIQGKLYDDRPPRSVPFIDRLNEMAEEMLDHFPNPLPPYTQEGLDAKLQTT